MSSRLRHIDLARGLIIALMALDHARLFIARDHPSEFWGVPLPIYGDHTVAFLTRLVTHLCAPGFCFLMGMSMALLAARSDWSRVRLARHFAARGALLLVLQHLIENPAWLLGTLSAQIPTEAYGVTARPGASSQLLLHFGVLSMLGGVMIGWGPLLRARSAWIAALSAAALLVPAFIMPDPSTHPTVYGLGWNLLYIPGRSTYSQVLYPLLPWAGVCGLGILCGRAPSRAWQWPAVAAVVAAGLWAAVRFGGGIGNLHLPAEPGWIGLLNATKYPPSWAFLAMSLGVFWVLLAVLARARLQVSDDHPLIVFGQTALGFYVVHLYVYAAISYAFPQGASF
ncbi:MAG: putative membrane protein, partial [Myxococcota bacterium]